MESFTDGRLITLALEGDREAISEISKLIASKLTIKNRILLEGFYLIGQGSDPDKAFGWKDRSSRLNLSHAARQAKEALLLSDLCNDLDLHYYVLMVFKGLAAGREPVDAFNWRQKKVGALAKHCNALRDWDICMTYHNLRRDGHKREIAIQVIYELTNLHKTSIERITKSLTGDNEPDFPESIFPLPTDELIRQSDFEKALSKVLKNNK
jgi:hypothetical protein